MDETSNLSVRGLLVSGLSDHLVGPLAYAVRFSSNFVSSMVERVALLVERLPQLFLCAVALVYAPLAPLVPVAAAAVFWISSFGEQPSSETELQLPPAHQWNSLQVPAHVRRSTEGRVWRGASCSTFVATF